MHSSADAERGCARQIQMDRPCAHGGAGSTYTLGTCAQSRVGMDGVHTNVCIRAERSCRYSQANIPNTEGGTDVRPGICQGNRIKGYGIMPKGDSKWSAMQRKEDKVMEWRREWDRA